MTLVQYYRAIRTNWIIAIALVIIGGSAGWLYAALKTPLYEAHTQLFISISADSADVSQLSQGGSFSQQRVKSYTSLVTSPIVINAVISSLDLPFTADELSAKISASSPVNTVLLNISVTDSSPHRARDIANALSTEFPRLIDSIETPVGRSTSPVRASVTRPADLPVSPVSPRLKLDLAVGLAIGLVAGIGCSVLRSTLDRTIRGKNEIAIAADAAVVGEVTDDGIMKRRPLIVEDKNTPRGEAFRTLRTNIRFLSVDRKLSSFVVTGSLPNEGKTTIAANLAIALAQAGEPVVLVDGDLRRPSVAGLFALSEGVGLTNILLGDVPLNHAMQQWRDDLPLYVITAGPIPPNPSELLGSHRLAKMVASLEASNLTVVFDSPPLLPVTDAAILAKVTAGALVVTRVGSTLKDQLGAAVDALRAVDAVVLGVVANRVRRKRKSMYDGYYMAQPSGWRQTFRTSGVGRGSSAADVVDPFPKSDLRGSKRHPSSMAR